MKPSLPTPTPLPIPGARDAPFQVNQYDDAGRLSARTEVLQGLPHGTMTVFTVDDKVAAQAPYEAGALHGVLKIFD